MYRLVPANAIACTSPNTVTLESEPTGDQFAPSHFAILFAVTPPAVAKPPPTYRFVPSPTAQYAPFTPEPNADQWAPSHLAMPLAPTPASLEKLPSTYKLVPLEARPFTATLVIPEPSADQLAPSHLATRFTVTPPAFVKVPPAYTLVSCTTAKELANEPAGRSGPKADQKEPFHRPM